MADRQLRQTKRAAAVLAAQLPTLLEPAATAGRQSLAHLIAIAEAITSALAVPTRTAPQSISQLLLAWGECKSQHSATICQVAHGCNERQLRERAASAIAAAQQALTTDPLPPAVTSFVGPVRLSDLIAGLTVSLGKLAQHFGARLDPASTQQALRALAVTLEERYPGHTIELRVPPVTAVQLGPSARGRRIIAGRPQRGGNRSGHLLGPVHRLTELAAGPRRAPAARLGSACRPGFPDASGDQALTPAGPSGRTTTVARPATGSYMWGRCVRSSKGVTWARYSSNSARLLRRK